MNHSTVNPEFLRARKFTAYELQLKVLWFLKKAPRHGYGLIQCFSDLSNGYYQPSPGMLYPVLAQLEAQGWAEVKPSGKRKVYHLSSIGDSYLQAHQEQAQLLIAQLKHAAKKMTWMHLINQEGGQLNAIQATGWLAEFIQARKDLQQALLLHSDADHTEQRRLIKILQEATKEILNKINEGPMSNTPYAVQKMQHPIKVRLLQIKQITELSSSMRRITLTGDLEGFYSASFDDHVKLMLPHQVGEKPNLPTLGEQGLVFDENKSKPLMRDYTPRRYDPIANELDIDFVLHHPGPATTWASQAEVGHYLGIGGPRGSMVIPSIFDWHLLMGDESALPAIARRLEELPAHAKAIAVIKLRREDDKIELQNQCSADIRWVVQNEADEVEALSASVEQIVLPAGEGYVWAAGEYNEIKALRQKLIESFALDKRRIRASSYWRLCEQATHTRFED